MEFPRRDNAAGNAMAMGTNGILDALSPPCRANLLKRMELVALPATNDQALSLEAPDFAHFLVSGLASVAVAVEGGASFGTSLIGSEGLLEVHHLLGPVGVPVGTIMLMPGAGYRLPLAELKVEFSANEELRTAMLHFVHCQMQVTTQLAACSHSHVIEARLARFLLMVADRVGGSEFPLTHGWLAQMLGVRRPTLTLAAGAFQREGMITYSRGVVRIRDREALEAQACACYGQIAQLYF